MGPRFAFRLPAPGRGHRGGGPAAGAALTATANLAAREEIAARLGMRDPRAAARVSGDGLIAAVEEAEKPGIVYVSSRRSAEEMAHELSDRGVLALHYHGGMPAREGALTHTGLMEVARDGMVATSAFGMGGKVNARDIAMVAGAVSRHDGPIGMEELKQQAALSKVKPARAIARLEETGAVSRLPTGGVRAANQRRAQGTGQGNRRGTGGAVSRSCATTPVVRRYRWTRRRRSGCLSPPRKIYNGLQGHPRSQPGGLRSGF